MRVCREILQSLGFRAFRPQVTACPGCGRTTSTLFQELAQRIERHLAERMAVWREERPGRRRPERRGDGLHRQRPGREPRADIGLSLPGTGEEPRAPVYVDGEKVATLQGPTLAEDFIAMVEAYVVRRYPLRAGSGAPA